MVCVVVVVVVVVVVYTRSQQAWLFPTYTVVVIFTCECFSDRVGLSILIHNAMLMTFEIH